MSCVVHYRTLSIRSPWRRLVRLASASTASSLELPAVLSSVILMGTWLEWRSCHIGPAASGPARFRFPFLKAPALSALVQLLFWPPWRASFCLPRRPQPQGQGLRLFQPLQLFPQAAAEPLPKDLLASALRGAPTPAGMRVKFSLVHCGPFSRNPRASSRAAMSIRSCERPASRFIIINVSRVTMGAASRGATSNRSAMEYSFSKSKGS